MIRVPDRWEEQNLKNVVLESTSVRNALKNLGLRGAGGNYKQFELYTRKYSIDLSHFTGQAWARGKKVKRRPVRPLDEILIKESHFSTFHLKERLFKQAMKKPECEECGWAKRSKDGRIPVELDHINGDPYDNRIENLRILCPNCHSLKPTHRGRNKASCRGGEMVDAQHLKC